jgi:hypothetical protein
MTLLGSGHNLKEISWFLACRMTSVVTISCAERVQKDTNATVKEKKGKNPSCKIS